MKQQECVSLSATRSITQTLFKNFSGKRYGAKYASDSVSKYSARVAQPPAYLLCNGKCFNGVGSDWVPGSDGMESVLLLVILTVSSQSLSECLNSTCILTGVLTVSHVRRSSLDSGASESPHEWGSWWRHPSHR